MNVFDLRNQLIQDYASYIQSFIEIRDERIRQTVDQNLEAGVLWPEPLIQLNPNFEAGESIPELVKQGVLHTGCEQVFRIKNAKEGSSKVLRLHKHQADAVRTARTGDNYVLTTGTGSGKSLAYIVPIVDSVLRSKVSKGIKAIVVYPMNALANSQFRELQKFLCQGFPDGKGPVTFEQYTGQESREVKNRIVSNPPDILLTNFVMLELILTRPDELPLVKAAQGLRFLVLDELHTYRGRQGADVALLCRRVRDAMNAPSLQFVGTSATLAGPGNFDSQRREVAKVAGRIFGAAVKPESVIGETLRRGTENKILSSPAFVQALTERVNQPATPEASFDILRRDPLAIWVESVLGLTKEEGTGRLVRARPRSISSKDGAAAELSAITNVPERQCGEAIQRVLLAGYHAINPETGFPLFAFRQHQFISRGDTVYASLQSVSERFITVQGQKFVPNDRNLILFPMGFCRECGQEYYLVRRQRSSNDRWSFSGRELNDRSTDENGGEAGFLFFSQSSPWPESDDLILDRLPDDWLEEVNGELRVRSTQKRNLPETVLVAGNGLESTEGLKCQFFLAPFKFCLNCGVSYSGRQMSDYAKLSNVGAGGRSTATTILALSTIRKLRNDIGLSPKARKLLSFTDNRQDASLQAGHFNDFVQVTLLRAALCRAAQLAGPDGITHDQLALKVFEALGLPLHLYASDPTVRFKAREDTDRAMREVIGYQLFLDLERGWRIASPNLEQCGLLEIAYQSLDEVCSAEDVWHHSYDDGTKTHPALQTASPATRKKIAKVLLDLMRRELAVKVNYLDSMHQDLMRQLSYQRLCAPWAFDEDEKLRTATVLIPRSVRRKDYGGDMYLSPRGGFGQYLKRVGTLAHYGQKLSADDIQKICVDLLEALRAAGLVEIVRPAEDAQDVHGYQLVASGMLWKAGDGTKAFHDPIRVPQQSSTGSRTNPFFVELYRSDLQDIQGLEAREHTAQVPNEKRQEREERFREAQLPILFCSPTMELGVDIAELNVVNMRNVPPTPANYAQRSGRAGRSGQPALVFTYCTTGSSHDQYFFKRAEMMVAGKVSPPSLELANEDLVRAHTHAIWLSETKQDLGSSLKDILEMSGDEPSLKLQDRVRDALTVPAFRDRALQRAERVLADLLAELEFADWYHDKWLPDVLAQVIQSFENSCKRWRALYLSARKQFMLQNKVILDASRSPDDKRTAERLRGEAEAQLRLLTDAKSAVQSDFYSYRYFASEGFLPGYNFPRLPISAFIPARRMRGQDEFLSRPRFLAITEFGPRSFIYHEGSKYIINRVIMPVQDEGPALTKVKLCNQCGYLHEVDASGHPDLCEHCGVALDAPLHDLFRLQNVSTKRRDRINSDEEERVRLGYEVVSGVRFTEHGGKASYRTAQILSGGSPMASLNYGHGATIWRINKGWRRREDKNQCGFVLDMERGYWQRNTQIAEDDQDDPSSPNTRRVIPFVEDWRNSLLIKPTETLSLIEMASLQAALKNAIQAVFQLEDDEIAAEPLPSVDDRRLLLLYESAEGGAGVLRRLLDDRGAIAAVAKEALSICHFDPLTGEDLKHSPGLSEDCEAACYNCLMSYGNQPDHRNLDRKAIRDFLMKLAAATVDAAPAAPPRAEHLDQLKRLAGSQLEIKWLEFLEQHGLRLPLQAQSPVPQCHTRPDFLYENSVAIYVDGPPHDYPDRQQRDQKQTDAMMDAGYVVIRFRHCDDWMGILKDYPNVFGTPNR